MTVLAYVRVANRDFPLTHTSGVLRVIHPGNLVLVNGTIGTIVWSSNTSGPLQNPVTQLLDSGNLVLRDTNNDGVENFIWQSFDHPTYIFTSGYMSPEYAVDGLFSIKSDVFSFGVLVLEIVSGKKNRGYSHSEHSLNLLGHAWTLYREWRSAELVDSFPDYNFYSSIVLQSILVGLLCVQQKPRDRPTMSSVVLMLGSEGEIPRAKQPGFFTQSDVVCCPSSTSSKAPNSANDVTITMLEPR
ncbi:hypothetical protein BUALT_Bualt09G0007300 [Buddleja alternifolia]|uniref:Bulb-type lectin domain-containing protein n=1 Tax=Buddleja alternifolia TaxID=168488 RepID=A0AAV6X639_9LAMI|nr:hypothetical protein BUALT_Bualt09G0007300 [Buddleja alternifolia]